MKTESDLPIPLGRLALWILFCISALLLSKQSFPCSTVFIPYRDHNLVAHNFDWDFEHGYILTNARGLQKKSLPFDKDDVPLKWVSKYGSVTLNQVGKEFPMSGMNELGLTITNMQNDELSLPNLVEGKPTLNELQWIQYQLDNYSSVKEVVAHLREIAISQVLLNLHFMICDLSAECAVVEFLGGSPTVYYRDSLPIRVLTNDKYQYALTNAKMFKSLGGTLDLVFAFENSLQRFVQAAVMVQDHVIKPANQVYTESQNYDFAFKVLEKISQDSYTKWNTVFDVTERSIRFRNVSHPRIRKISFSDFNFNCSAPAQAMKIVPKGSKSLDQFEPFNFKMQRELVNESAAYLKGSVPRSFLRALKQYPKSLTCRAAELAIRMR